MSIGERISQLRKENNISQQQLARALDVSRQAVSKWENDLTSPDTVKLIQLADVLNTEVEYLATGVKPIYESPPIVVNIVKNPDIIEERIVERIVEKPIIKKVFRNKYLRNPVEFSIVALIFFIIGIVVGVFIL